MAELYTIGAGTVNLRVTCDRRGCSAVGGAATPVAGDETKTTALTRCRNIIGARWRLTPGLTLCIRCCHLQGCDQPTLFGAEVAHG